MVSDDPWVRPNVSESKCCFCSPFWYNKKADSTWTVSWEFHVAEKAWVFSSRRVRRLCMSLKWRWVVQNSIGIGAETVVHVWQYTIFSRVHLRANNEMVCCLLASLFGFCVALFVGLSVCFGLVCLLVGLVWFSLVWFVRWLVWSVLVWCSLVCFACCLVLFWLIICFFLVCLFVLFVWFSLFYRYIVHHMCCDACCRDRAAWIPESEAGWQVNVERSLQQTQSRLGAAMEGLASEDWGAWICSVRGPGFCDLRSWPQSRLGYMSFLSPTGLVFLVPWNVR